MTKATIRIINASMTQMTVKKVPLTAAPFIPQVPYSLISPIMEKSTAGFVASFKYSNHEIELAVTPILSVP